MAPVRAPLVLLVDADPHQRRFLRHLLDTHGYAVTEAADALTAAAALDRTMPGVVLADADAPDLDPVDFCRELGEETRRRGVPFILLSRLSDADAGVAASFADEVLVKPAAHDAILVALRRRLGGLGPAIAWG